MQYRKLSLRDLHQRPLHHKAQKGLGGMVLSVFLAAYLGIFAATREGKYIDDEPFIAHFRHDARCGAAICAEAICAGIISHHQNMFPWTVSPLQALRDIRKEVGNSFKILIDSYFETGYDVFKALAFGAGGVFVARPPVPVFREKVLEGVAEHIRSMTDELRCALSRTASPDIAHIDPDVVVKL